MCGTPIMHAMPVFDDDVKREALQDDTQKDIY